MTTVTLRIQLDKSGVSEDLGKLKQDLKGVGEEGQRSGTQASQGVGALSTALNGAKAAVGALVAAFAAIQSVSAIANMADEYQQLSDRLKLVTDGTAAYASAQAGVFEVAQQTGTALSSVGGLYASLAGSTKELGLSQSELLTITGAVSQSFAIFGTDAGTASGAIRQLGQAFASGVLRGDEFNSLMESAPPLMQALASALGVTTGELRKMAEAGKLTDEVIATGILNKAPEIAAQFGQMNLTIGQAFTQLSNSVTKFVGELSQASGAGNTLALAISGLAAGLPGFAIALGAVAAGYTAVSLQAIAANAGLLTTTGLVAGLGAALGLLVAAYAGYKLGEYMVNESTFVQTAVRSLYVGLNDLWAAIQEGAIRAFTGIRTAWTTVVDAIQEKIADLLEAFLGMAEVELPFGLRADFAYGQAEALRTLATELRSATDATKENDQATAAMRAQVQQISAETEAFAASMFDSIDEHKALKKATKELSDEQGRQLPKFKDLDAATNALKQAQESAKRASKALAEEQERLTAEMGGPAVEAAIDLAQRLRAVDEREAELRAGHALSRAEIERLNTIRGALISSYGEEAGRIRDAENAVQGYLRELREEVRIAGLTGTARAAAILQMNAENTARRLLKGATEDQVLALAEQIVALENQKTAADEAGQAAEDWAQYWQGASDAVVGAFSDLFSGGIDSLEEFGDRMLQISQRIVGDILEEFARTGQIRLPTGSDGTMRGNLTAGFQGLGYAYAGYQNAQQGGNPLATVGSFALAGAQIGSIIPGIGTAIGAVVGAVVGAIAAAFGGPGDPLLRVRSDEFSGSRRSEGRATSALGDIFIRTDNLESDTTSPEIAQRIADFDNLLASFMSADQLAAVRDRLDNVNETFRNGAATLEDALNSRLGAIVGALDSNIQAFVGTAGTLEERSQRLVDALTISNAAASGIISGDFDEMADLLTRFRQGTEGLGDTFMRIVTGMELVDQAMALLQVGFSGTRLEAATFAGELIELAGGLDQFSARLQGALNALFSEEERNQFIADQAQAALNSALIGLNISGVGVESIRTQLRDQLREAMQAGNSELVNQILIAANALGAFSTALEALGDDATAAAGELFFGRRSVESGGSIGPGELGGGTGGASAVPATQLEAGQAMVRAQGRSNELLAQIVANTARESAGEKRSGDGETLKRIEAHLARIGGAVDQGVRSQTQESLKRTTGANKRGAAIA